METQTFYPEYQRPHVCEQCLAMGIDRETLYREARAAELEAELRRKNSELNAKRAVRRRNTSIPFGFKFFAFIAGILFATGVSFVLNAKDTFDTVLGVLVILGTVALIFLPRHKVGDWRL